MNNDFIEILSSGYDRSMKAKRIAAKICSLKNYSWAGLYDVFSDTICAIGWSGKEPAYPSFPKNKGLNGRAVASKSIIVVNDTAADADYLTTFGHTQSEIIVPVFSERTNEIVGTIDVESRDKNAFDKSDIEFLKECSILIKELW